jgi:hypothetical protein
MNESVHCRMKMAARDERGGSMTDHRRELGLSEIKMVRTPRRAKRDNTARENAEAGVEG